MISVDAVNQTFTAIVTKSHPAGSSIRPSMWPTAVLLQGNDLAFDIRAVASTGPPAPSTCGARACSRATVRRAANARAWPSQTANAAAGIGCGALIISAKDSTESPLRIYGPGSNLADHRLLEVTAGAELILAGVAGNGYRLAELMAPAIRPDGLA